MSRLEANRAILGVITELVERYPDQRFGQLMRNYGVIKEIRNDWIPVAWSNEFNLESDELLKRIVKTTAEIEVPDDAKKENPKS